jgi:hypothetical protein
VCFSFGLIQGLTLNNGTFRELPCRWYSFCQINSMLFQKTTSTPDSLSVCECGAIVFFENSFCVSCGRMLGFFPGLNRMTSVNMDADAGLGTSDSRELRGQTFRCCKHRESALGCNWMIPSSDPATLCQACQLTRTFPDIQFIGNDTKWSRAEAAKRRVAAQLLRLGVPLVSLMHDPRGVCFDFLQDSPDGSRVLTGHEEGVITLNVDEADDVQRESMRQQMGEEYRTLAGHIRHELAHYYWDVLAKDEVWLQSYRQQFGDEKVDYSSSLASYYANGPAPDWNSRCITPYASSHPWEDWAETFAHFLHLHEGLHVAQMYGLDPESLKVSTGKFTTSLLQNCEPKADAKAFIKEINGWVKLSLINNEMARALGHLDSYPFVFTAPVVSKLWFIRQSFPKIRQALQSQPAVPPSAAPVILAK